MAKMRSPNYPACGLSEAVKTVKKLWDKEQGTVVSPDDVAKAIGYKSLSGPARTIIAAMKKFGLLTDDKQGLKVSQLALHILHPANESEHQAALREAAFKPELFKELAGTHLQASDDALKSHLITRLGFSETGAKALIEAFRDTMGIEKVSKLSYGSPDPKSGDQAMENNTLGKNDQNAQKTRVFSWPLSKDVSAEVRLTGKAIEPAHLDILAKYIELAKVALKAT